MFRKMLMPLLLLGMLALPALSLAAPVTNAQEPYQIQDTGGQVSLQKGVNDAAYDIDISKTIYRTLADGQTELAENFFDIELTVRTHVHAQQEISTDVVIVMDISNTMNDRMDSDTKPSDYKDSRLYMAKEAAKIFVDKYAANTNLDVRTLGMVVFDTSAETVVSMTDMTKSGSADSVKNKIDGIKTVDADNANEKNQRFTNIEGGLQLARNLLKGSSADYKYVILITDGFPTTYSITTGNTSKSYIAGYEPITPQNALFSTADGFFAYTLGSGVQRSYLGTNYSNKGALRAADVAQALKKTGSGGDNVNIFSIGVALGAQDIDNFAAFTIDTVGMKKGDQYAIGNSTATYKKWLRETISGGAAITASGRTSYFDANSKTQLQEDLDNIFQTINVEPQLDSRQFYTLDPMGDDVEFLGFYNKDGALVSGNLTGQSKLNQENTASFSSDKINWNLLNSGFTTTTGSIGGMPVTYYNFKLRYRVRLENETFSPGEFSAGVSGGASTDKPANKQAKLHWETYDAGTQQKIGSGSVPYPDPKIEGYKGELSFIKRGNTDDDPEPELLSNAEFELIHRGASCPICRGEASFGPYTAISDDNGVVSFSNIPSGHHYVLHESEPPEGYQRVHDHSVIVAYGKTYIMMGTDDSGNAVNKLLVGGKFSDGASFIVDNDKAIPVELQFVLHKELADATLTEGQFAFKLSGLTQHGSPFESTVKNDADGRITFPQMLFDESGTFEYVISEVTGTDETIVYDDADYVVKIESDHHNESGADDWHVKVSLEKQGEDSFTPVGPNNGLYTGANPQTSEKLPMHVIELDSLQAFFSNSMRPQANLLLSAQKELLDAQGNPLALPEGKFAFELQEVNIHGEPIGEPIVQANDASGKASFSCSHGASGTYYYTLRELPSYQSDTLTVPRDPDFFYDTRIWDVTVTITSPPDLTSSDPFSSTVTYVRRVDRTESTENATFTNSLKQPASLEIRAAKRWKNGKLPKANAFAFELVQTDETGVMIGEPQIVYNNAKGEFSFDLLRYVPTVEADTTPHGVHHYRLREIISEEYNKKVIYDPAIYRIDVLIPDEHAEAYHPRIAVYRLLPDSSETLVAIYEGAGSDVVFDLDGERMITFINDTIPNIPSTGDHSRLALWIGLLAFCGTALLLVRKRRAA